MATPLEHKIRRELLEWCQHSPPPVQLRCITIAINLARLASDSDNLELRRETMRYITSLEAALRVTRETSQEHSHLKGAIKQRTSPTAAPRRRLVQQSRMILEAET